MLSPRLLQGPHPLLPQRSSSLKHHLCERPSGYCASPPSALMLPFPDLFFTSLHSLFSASFPKNKASEGTKWGRGVFSPPSLLSTLSASLMHNIYYATSYFPLFPFCNLSTPLVHNMHCAASYFPTYMDSDLGAGNTFQMLVPRTGPCT